MADRDGRSSPSSRDIAGEDFLFHLYRGSELLQDNRVHDAKAELEQALSLQPSDPKGQDLLGIVYFRLGLYPRAIAIYERLIQMHPEAIEPRINIALCYLKTGQAALARSELERVVAQNPHHSRAWGYLGLCFQRLGDYERASYAFASGGHEAMARRVLEMGAPQPPLSIRPVSMLPKTGEIREAAGEAVAELDRGDVAFRSDQEARERLPVGAWAATEPGREHVVPPPPNLPSLVPPPPSARVAPSIPPPSSRLRPPVTAPRKALAAARDALLVFPRDLDVSLHASGMVLVQSANGFATRMEIVRSMTYTRADAATKLMRRARGRPLDEALGGEEDSIFELSGRGELVLGPPKGHKLEPIALDDEPLYLREDVLSGFSRGVGYENGRLPLGDGEAITMVQLRGPGTAILMLPIELRSIEVIEAQSVALRADTALGWVGRLGPRALVASEAPAGARGFVVFSGEGMVFVDGR